MPRLRMLICLNGRLPSLSLLTSNYQGQWLPWLSRGGEADVVHSWRIEGALPGSQIRVQLSI